MVIIQKNITLALYSPNLMVKLQHTPESSNENYQTLAVTIPLKNKVMFRLCIITTLISLDKVHQTKQFSQEIMSYITVPYTLQATKYLSKRLSITVQYEQRQNLAHQVHILQNSTKLISYNAIVTYCNALMKKYIVLYTTVYTSITETQLGRQWLRNRFGIKMFSVIGLVSKCPLARH